MESLLKFNEQWTESVAPSFSPALLSTVWLLTSSCPFVFVLIRVWLFCDPLDCGLPGSSVRGIFQAKILEWVAISSSRWSSWLRDQTSFSCVFCTAGGFFTHWAMGEVLLTSYSLMAESEELKSFLMKVKEEREKAGLKLNLQKTKIMASGPIASWQIDGETVANFIFLGSKITADGDCSHEIKRCLLLGRKVMTNLDNVLKSRDITLPTKVH